MSEALRVTRLRIDAALLLGLSLLTLGYLPSAEAHEAHKHEVPKETPVTPTMQGAPLAEHPQSTFDHEHPGEKVPGETHAHPYPPEGVPRPLAWLGKFHPPAVNFPIAMFVAAALSELLLIRTGRELFFHATRFVVWVGALGAIAAAGSGWFFAGFHIGDEKLLLTIHRWLGTAASGWAVLVLFLCERAYRTNRRQAFRLALIPGAALIAANGFFGGALVYGIDHYKW